MRMRRAASNLAFRKTLKFLPPAGTEPGTLGIGDQRLTNCATGHPLCRLAKKGGRHKSTGSTKNWLARLPPTLRRLNWGDVIVETVNELRGEQFDHG